MTTADIIQLLDSHSCVYCICIPTNVAGFRHYVTSSLLYTAAARYMVHSSILIYTPYINRRVTAVHYALNDK